MTDEQDAQLTRLLDLHEECTGVITAAFLTDTPAGDVLAYALLPRLRKINSHLCALGSTLDA